MYKLIKLLYFPLLCKFAYLKMYNVVFIIVDDLKPCINKFGDRKAYTPNIDVLAENSFLFSNAFSQQALCAPSRNSFLTSRRPDSLRLYDFYSYWRNTVGNFTTLPQFFKENGYYTYSIGKIFHPGVSSNFTDDYPYSWTVKPFHPKTDIYKDAKVCITKDRTLASNLICPVVIEAQPEKTLPDLESLNEAIHFLRNRDSRTNDPYFLAVGFHKPHIPFKFPVQYLEFHPYENITLPKYRWMPPSLPDVAWNPWNDVRERDDMKILNIPFPYGPMPDDMLKKIIQAYYASTSYIDYLIGRLLKEVGNDTIIIFTSDHGWSLGEHGELAKYSNFEEATRVPLLIHVPGMSKKNLVVDSLVELVDLFPTLVDLTQISEPLPICPINQTTLVCTEGQSLVPIMVDAFFNKQSKGKRAIFTQYPRAGEHPSWKPDSDKPHLKDIKIMGYSIKTKRYRYAEWVGFDPKNFIISWDKVYGRELYDHLIDPMEDMNLADRSEMSNIVNRLRRKLINGWRCVTFTFT